MERLFATKSLRVEPLLPVPQHLLGIRQEFNQLDYGPSSILLARDDDAAVVGAVRFALRHDSRRQHGLIADLQVDEEHRIKGTPDALIRAAEQQLRMLGVRKVDALIPDGEGWAPYFYRLGFWASRKTVIMALSLTDLAEPTEAPAGVTIERVEQPEVETLTQLVANSYQPYWRWWREAREDKRWERVEYPADNPPLETAELELEMRDRIRLRIARITRDPLSVVFVAHQGNRVVGMCDATRHLDGDQLDFGVLVLRDFGGRRLGSALLGRALHWLRVGGLAEARVTTTSGLDDYDPTVYLYNLAYSAQIVAEYVDLVKRADGSQTDTA